MYAAPSTFDTSNPFLSINQKVIEHWDKLKCVSDVIDGAFDKSDISTLWSESMNRGFELVNDEWAHCDLLEDNVDKLR